MTVILGKAVSKHSHTVTTPGSVHWCANVNAILQIQARMDSILKFKESGLVTQYWGRLLAHTVTTTVTHPLVTQYWGRLQLIQDLQRKESVWMVQEYSWKGQQILQNILGWSKHWARNPAAAHEFSLNNSAASWRTFSSYSVTSDRDRDGHGHGHGHGHG